MVTVKKEGIILEKTTLGFESESVLNPAVMQEGNTLHLFYRAVKKENYSTIGYCKLEGPTTILERMDTPLLIPEFDYESNGIEDPRIVKIDGVYYLTYCAFDGVNALGALAISENLVDWEKKGIIVPQITYSDFDHLSTCKKKLNNKYARFNSHEGFLKKNGKKILLWDKNVVLFPRKINGSFVFLHRIKPDIQIAYVKNELEEVTNTKYWQNYLLHFDETILIKPKYNHESSYVGSGCPPIETDEGWLVIYHGVKDSVKGYIYSACAALLDLENPSIEIARLPYPLFKPDLPWELKGDVSNVCFPSGTSLFGDTLYIYYGAADKCIACASLSLSELLNELILNTVKNEK